VSQSIIGVQAEGPVVSGLCLTQVAIDLERLPQSNPGDARLWGSGYGCPRHVYGRDGLASDHGNQAHSNEPFNRGRIFGKDLLVFKGHRSKFTRQSL